MKPFPGREPVFVDPTGRRHRTIRRAGALLAVPAGGYVVLLISSLLGGPSLDTPLIPLPEAVRPASRPQPATEPSAPSVGDPVAPVVVESADTERTASPTSTSPAPTAVPSTPATFSPSTATPSTTDPSTPGRPTEPPTASTTAPPTSTATASTPERRPTVPPGRTNSPTKPPTGT